MYNFDSFYFYSNDYSIYKINRKIEMNPQKGMTGIFCFYLKVFFQVSVFFQKVKFNENFMN